MTYKKIHPPLELLRRGELAIGFKTFIVAGCKYVCLSCKVRCFNTVTLVDIRGTAGFTFTKLFIQYM